MHPIRGLLHWSQIITRTIEPQHFCWLRGYRIGMVGTCPARCCYVRVSKEGAEDVFQGVGTTVENSFVRKFYVG
jgi:hypothetical protein